MQRNMFCSERNKKECRGSVLPQAMVLILLLALMAASLLKVNLGRHVTVHKANSSTSARLLAESVRHQAYACLEGTDFGVKSCLLSGVSCLPKNIEGRKVQLKGKGSPPNCRLEILLED